MTAAVVVTAIAVVWLYVYTRRLVGVIERLERAVSALEEKQAERHP